MKNLNQHLNDYLKLRRQLGYKLQEAEFLLRNFVRFVEEEGTGVITAKLAVRWAARPNMKLAAADLSGVRALMRALKERHRFVRGMVAWVGFRQTAAYYDREARFAGETKYPLRKMVRFAIDGITSFSTVPLRFATWLGVFAGLMAVVIALWAVYIKLFVSGAVQGWTTIMIVVALGTSAQLLMIGILGEYIGRIYEEVKRRPLYLVAEEINLEQRERLPTKHH